MIQLPKIKQIQTILKDYSTIAIVGLSPKPDRPSNQVARYMLAAGYRIIPVNPGHDRILDQVCYPELSAVPENVDIVDIFRRSEQVLPIVQAGIAKEARVIWMQEGIINEEAAKLAEKHGLAVIMDRCIMIDHQHFVQRFEKK